MARIWVNENAARCGVPVRTFVVSPDDRVVFRHSHSARHTKLQQTRERPLVWMEVVCVENV